MSIHVSRSFVIAAGVFCAGSLFGQTAELALSTSVGYNTQRLSLPLSPEQGKEAERLGNEATKATRAGKFGEALDDYAHGQAVMHKIDWTPDVEYASALRAKIDHGMAAPGKVTVSLTPLYSTEHASSAKLNAALVLVGADKSETPLAPPAPVSGTFSKDVVLPASAAGDPNIEVRLTEADGSAPKGLNGVFVKTVPIHVEALTADAQKLRDGLAKVAGNNGPAVSSAAYTLALYERADKEEVNPHAYNFKKEFTTAQMIVDSVQAGKDPFAGKKGDFRKAYKSNVDQTLQPYRLFIPDSYDGTKPASLVVALHGMGGDENSMFDSYGKELPVDANAMGFIVVAPKGRGQASMYRGTAEQDVMDAMAEVRRDYKVDPSRIYLMGHSMGGFGTWSIAMDHPEVFAALGPISGGGSAEGMVKIKDIPQYVTHGDNDKTVAVDSSRSMVAAGKKAGAPITYVEVPGGSHVSVAQPAFKPMMEFFSKQSKGSL
jgi:predicted esterase